MSRKTPLPFAAVRTEGKLYARAMRNFDRLESEKYDLDHVFQDGKYVWPGDWEGRTILGLTLLAQATHREPRHLQAIMERLPDHLNDRGYYGNIMPDGIFDEQQLSGNSWLLRAMVEHYRWKRDDISYRIVQDIVQNLLLPVRGSFRTYPVMPEQRLFHGEAMGSLQEKRVGCWHLSTDIGCAFIMLDGATQAYELLRTAELKELLEEMVDKFMTIDLQALSFQTHATLSALRGLLRYFETTGDHRVLMRAEDIFALYCTEGMTENYANYNWFGRPDWTEPCAVIDSFLAAVGLWRHTAKSAYLEAAHHILYNGMGYGQRPNGGFGCDTCAGAHDEWLSPKNKGLYEAFWCCTMRGGEGLAQAIRYGYFQDERGVDLPFYSPGTATITFPDGALTLIQSTEYPLEGSVCLEVTASSLTEPKALRLHVPSWSPQDRVSLRKDGVEQANKVENGFVEIVGRFPAGTVIELAFAMDIREENTFNRNSIAGRRSFRRGALLLGVDNPDGPISVAASCDSFLYMGDGKYRLPGSAAVLEPIFDMIDKTNAEAVINRKQVLFS